MLNHSSSDPALSSGRLISCLICELCTAQPSLRWAGQGSISPNKGQVCRKLHIPADCRSDRAQRSISMQASQAQAPSRRLHCWETWESHGRPPHWTTHHLPTHTAPTKSIALHWIDCSAMDYSLVVSGYSKGKASM